MSRISEIAREMKTWWSDEGSDIEVQDALDEIIRLDDAEQTEPQTDCEGCKFKSGVFCIVDGDCKYFDRYEPKDEPSNSENPNNCEHITEDGVTCAKYPACDDCLDNPLNKVKGSERLVKSSEQTEPTISKMEQVDKDINVRSKDEPQADCAWR